MQGFKSEAGDYMYELMLSQIKLAYHLSTDEHLSQSAIQIYSDLYEAHERLESMTALIALKTAADVLQYVEHCVPAGRSNLLIKLLQKCGFISPFDKRKLTVSKASLKYILETASAEKDLLPVSDEKTEPIPLLNKALNEHWGFEIVSAGSNLYRLNTFDLWTPVSTKVGIKLVPVGYTISAEALDMTTAQRMLKFNSTFKRNFLKERIKEQIKNKSSHRRRSRKPKKEEGETETEVVEGAEVKIE